MSSDGSHRKVSYSPAVFSMLADHLFVRGHSQIHNLLVGPGTEGFLELVGGIGGGDPAVRDWGWLCCYR